MDGWTGVVEALDAHFSRKEEQTVGNKPIDGFVLLEPSEKTASFIDGGNIAIFSSPSACVHAVRIAVAAYHGKKRLSARVLEAFCTVTRAEKEWLLCWHGQDWQGFSVLVDDFETPDSVAELGRKKAERFVAKDEKGIVVFDGELDCLVWVHTPQLAAITDPDQTPTYPTACGGVVDFQQAGDVVQKAIGLAKTTTLLTDQGLSLPAVLVKAGPEKAWLFPLSENEGFVKLHASSRRAFRMQCAHIGLEEAARCLMCLSDASFIGYPQGLVLVDRLARVTEAEQRSLRESLRVRMKGRHDLEQASIDSHDVLDSLCHGRTSFEW